MRILGIGSRINHTKFGKGVVTNVSNKEYWVTFIDGGLETIPLDETFEIIEAADNEVDTVSFHDVEKSLKALLQKYSDIGPAVAIADKWRGGKLIMDPGQPGVQGKEVPIDAFFIK